MTEEEIAAMRSENERLKKTNSELVTKSSTRKQRIAELETASAELQSQLTTANGQIKSLTIDAPLQSMAEDISTCPEVFSENFGKTNRLELVNGELTIVSLSDGKPVMKDGKAVPFEKEALKALLLDEKHPQSKLFRAILIASKASGGDAPPQRREPSTAPKVSPRQFGLK